MDKETLRILVKIAQEETDRLNDLLKESKSDDMLWGKATQSLRNLHFLSDLYFVETGERV
jgi:hypothetical protein